MSASRPLSSLPEPGPISPSGTAPAHMGGGVQQADAPYGTAPSRQ